MNEYGIDFWTFGAICFLPAIPLVLLVLFCELLKYAEKLEMWIRGKYQ